MKCLTICQPYAHLIMLPDDDDRAKRVENRTWSTSYRGPLLIHAGKNRNWLELSDDGTRDEEYDIPLADMTFGAIVGVCQLVDCFAMEKVSVSVGHTSTGRYTRVPDHVIRARPWLLGHEHVEGPFCWVLTECRKFAEPIPYRGAQGLFDVPRDVVEMAVSQ